MIRNLCAKDVRMMYIQISLDVTEKRILVSARKMINIICHNVYATFVKATCVYTLLLWREPAYTFRVSIYAVFMRQSCVYTRIHTLKVAYAFCALKTMIPRGITMVLTHCIERWFIYLIPSRNTIGSCVVLSHGIDKGQIYLRRRKS